MKKFILPCLLVLGMVTSYSVSNANCGASSTGCCAKVCEPDNSCDVNATSRSYLDVRPLFQSVAPEMVAGFRDNRIHAREGGAHGAAQVVILGSKSTNSEDLARYFFPFGKTQLLVDEQIGALINQDLLAEHFNIFTVDGNFRSRITIDPEQSVVGAGFHVKQGFCINEERGRGFYASLSFPVLRVSNNMNLCENIENDGGGAHITFNNGTQIVDYNVQANMTEALNQCDWLFGKISPCALKKTGVADLELKVGYEWIERSPYHLESYLGIKVPTGNKPNSEYLFEPVVGNGHHWGIMFGSALGVEIWQDEQTGREFRLELNNHSQYLFNNTQCRSVDLFCKPWSRYIELYRDIDEAVTANSFNAAPVSNATLATNFATPGINVLTIPLKVRPGFSQNITTAAVFTTPKWYLEAGYNVYFRQSECLKLACPWVEGPAIKHEQGSGQTNPVRDITGNFRLENIDPGDATNLMRLQDYKFNFIKEEDLDIVSASSPGVISHTVYGAVGYEYPDRDIPVFGNIGGSYEFGHGTNAVLERWVIWAKLGLSY